MTRKRPVRIGITVNRRDRGYAPELQNQYTGARTFTDVAGALGRHGAEVVDVEVDDAFLDRISKLAPSLDLVFNLAEGLPRCRSRHVTAPAVADHLGLEHTGSLVQGHAVAADKALTRRILGDRVRQAPWWVLEHAAADTPPGIVYPVLVKPVREGFSVGIDENSVAGSPDELRAAVLRLAARIPGPYLVETYLDGVEYSIGVVGEVMLPAVRWDLRRLPGAPKVRGEDLKRQDLTIPHAELVEDPETRFALASQAAAAHTLLGLRDYSRSDLRARGCSPEPYFIETNSMPGLQDVQSVLPWTAGQAGVEYPDVIGSVAALALRRLDPERRRRLAVEPFDAAYARLKDLAEPTLELHVGDRRWRLLPPRPVAAAS